jgi:hypothetical protein
MLMRGTVTFFAAVAIALAAPLAVAQSGGTAPAATGSASTAPAAVSNGYVASGPVTIQRNGKLITAKTGDKLYPGDVVSASSTPNSIVQPSLVIDGKTYNFQANTTSSGKAGRAPTFKVTVPAPGGEVIQAKTSTQKSIDPGGKVTSTTSTTTTVLIGAALTAAVIAAASGNDKSSSP